MIPCFVSGGDDDDRTASLSIEVGPGGCSCVDMTLRCPGMPDVLVYLSTREARALAIALQAVALAADPADPD